MGPVAFTDSVVGQLSVPLSAFELSGSPATVQLTSAWQNTLLSADQAVLLALAQGKFAAGELFALPSPVAVPALILTAQNAGAGGNNIVVTVSLVSTSTPPSSPADPTAELTFSVTETDAFAGLSTVAQAASAVGVDNTSGTNTGLPAAGGLIEIVNDSTLAISSAALPVAASYTLDGAGPEQAVLGPSSETLFNIKPRFAFTATVQQIVVTVTQPTSSAFNISAAYASGTSSALEYSQLAALSTEAPDVAYLIGAVSAPPGGFALVPTTAQTVTLTGGGSVPATGVAYTS
jgi:hypothetical protein